MLPTAINDERRMWACLFGLAGGQAVLYSVMLFLSREFIHGQDLEHRPIIAVVALFAACFVLYIASIVVALRIHSKHRIGSFVLLWAIGFRGILLFSQPIQEVDIYRYIWDGAVTAIGENPFRYAPQQVRDAAATSDAESQRMPQDLRRISRMAARSPGLGQILERVHFGELTTVYPPVSQAMFALAHLVTPPTASVSTRISVMKAVLLIFDLATIGFVWLLLSATGKHRGWIIAYAWCPLAIKEFANSGHLDSIAVCLTTASLWCAVVLIGQQRCRVYPWLLSAAVLLGLAVGAKLYAIVVLPLVACTIAKTCGIRRGAAFGLATLACVCVCLSPMFMVESATAAATHSTFPDSPVNASADEDLTSAADETRETSGIAEFFSRWEMNDFLFLIVIENIRPRADHLPHRNAWFAVLPDSWRTAIVSTVSKAFSISHGRSAFLVSRVLTSIAFLAIAAFLVWKAVGSDSVHAVPEAAFLTLAWLWLLSPTQNPWYWTWALPLVAFSRQRAWLAVSGLAFAYYLRFWFLYHWPDETVWGTDYNGAAFFDYVVTWVEFCPWFAGLLVCTLAAEGTARSITGD